MISTMTDTASATTAAQAMTYSVILVIALIVFLSIKEVLTAEINENKQIYSFVEGSNIAIIPLLIVFIVLVIYKVIMII